MRMDNLKALESLGITLPGPAYIFGAILFSIVGFAAYRYGKKAGLGTPMWMGIVLMVYPYAISDTWLLYVIGGGLCLGLYVFRK